MWSLRQNCEYLNDAMNEAKIGEESWNSTSGTLEMPISQVEMSSQMYDSEV